MYNKLTAFDIVEHIKEIGTMEEPITLLILGKPGIGKSFSIMEGAKKLKRIYYVISLSRLEQMDIKGFPNIQGKYARWVPPELIEAIEKSEGNIIVHIEEFTLARREVQDGILDLIQFKRVDDRQLPKNTMFILTGNKGDDGTAARAISSAITGGRAEVFTAVPPTLKQYLDYESNLHKVLKKFLIKNGISVILQEPNREDPAAPWSCPRSFSELNRITMSLKLDLDKPKDIQRLLRHASSLLSENTVMKLEDYFHGSIINVTGLLQNNEIAWKDYSKMEAFDRSEALKSVCKEVVQEITSIITKEDAEERRVKLIGWISKLINMVYKYEKDKEIQYAFIFSIVEQDPEIAERVTIKDKKLSEIYEESISKKYKK